MHLLATTIERAARGEFPPADGAVEVVPPWRDGFEAVVALTGHAYVATSLGAAEVLAQGPDGFGGAMSPGFLLWLAGEGGIVGSHDALLVASGRGGSSLPERRDLDDHPRVGGARLLRDDVVVYGDERGLVTLGRGIGGLFEASAEVEPHRRSSGVGRSLLHDLLGVVPRGELVVAEVAPGNAQSLRAFLAAGFTPIGAATIVVPAGR